jgi:hypothetical protein
MDRRNSPRRVSPRACSKRKSGACEEIAIARKVLVRSNTTALVPTVRSNRARLASARPFSAKAGKPEESTVIHPGRGVGSDRFSRITVDPGPGENFAKTDRVR